MNPNQHILQTGKSASQMLRALLCMVCMVIAFVGATLPAMALEPVSVTKETTAIDLTNRVDLYSEVGDSLKISTAPDNEGIVRRIEVQARDEGSASNWAVFSLANEGSEQIDRLIVAPHYRLVNSGIIWPDLDSPRILEITPSDGFALERVADKEADVFSVTLDPGSVVTFVAERSSKPLPKLYLWEPSAYKDAINSYTLFRGIVLGISGLLAVFLTILFVVKGSAMFPATAALAWGVLAFICVDFGFWDKVVGLTDSDQDIWRAATEVFLAASLIIFIYAYLSLNRWNSHFSSITIAWILSLMILVGVALVQPAIASGIARISFAVTVAIGAGLIGYLAFQGYDRAVMLIPTWLLTIAWVIGAAITANGDISNDIVQPALGGGLVLIILLLGFTVMQHAFAGGALAQGLVSDVERQALALTGAGGIVWDWDVQRDVIQGGDEIATMLGLPIKSVTAPKKAWSELLHANDRDRFHAMLDAILEHRRGRISQVFRMRNQDGFYHWFRLKARPMLGVNNEVIRCVGTLVDVTDQKTAEERLLHDAVNDNLTGLENRELFKNRLETVVALVADNDNIRPSVFHINIDNFRDINNEHGFAVGDTILLSMARRLGRHLKPGDSIARTSADNFCILLVSETQPDRIAAFAEALRKSIKTPVKFANKDIDLTASIGIASWTAEQQNVDQLMRDAELAMINARRFGGDRIEPFRPAFRTNRDETVVLLEDLKQALNKRELNVLYQPIVDLQNRSTVGFEALMRWQHPRLGVIPPSEFIPIAERSGLINQLGVYVLEKACTEFERVVRNTGRSDCFVSVNLSSRELLRHDTINDIASALKKSKLPPKLLRIEVTESLVMQNPEHSSEVLSRVSDMGIGLSLDDFGTGYSSLSYLMRFPFDTIKIDKSFVQARERPERAVILRSIIAMAHGLNQKLVAEGVEMESDVAELMQLGCEQAQGYLFGEPMRPADIEAMLGEEYQLAGQ